jgi:glutamyl-tRNA reductase
MNILVVGLNHKTADVEVREKLAFDGEKLTEGLQRLRGLPQVNEAVVLSTCNRVEMYLNTGDVEGATEAVKAFLSEFHNIPAPLLENALYFHSGNGAVRHAFRVAASLDSMVMGEPQILGQFKDSFDASLRERTTGVLLNKLMKKAISVAKRVRTETKIAENAVSISFSAVELAKKIFTHLDKKSVMEMCVANRTYERGCELAEEMGGQPVRFEDFLHEMVRTDIVICSTGAPTYVVTRAQMQAVMKERKQKPVFMIDISVPRNIDPEVGDMANVFLYDVDDLQGVVDTNVEERLREAEKAQAIIEEEIETFNRWLSSLDAVPTIIALRERAEGIKQEELAKLLNRMPDLDEKGRKAMEQLAGAIVNKIIHPPTVALKRDSEDKDILIATIKRLFGLNDGE